MNVPTPHGGNIRLLSTKAGCPEEDLIDFSASINPAGPPQGLRAAINRTIKKIVHYPDRECKELAGAIASVYGCNCENIIVGNGSTELLYALPRALSCSRAIIPVPSYSDYAAAFGMEGVPIKPVHLTASNDFLFDIEVSVKDLTGGDAVIFGQPNNPTCRLVDRDAIVRAAREASSTYFIVDESFADFVNGYVSLISEELPNVIVLKSLTKFYAIPGIRLGFVHAAEPVISALRAILPSWSVNVFAQAAGIECLGDDQYATKVRQMISLDRKRQYRRLSAIGGLMVFDSCANFFLLRIDRDGLDAHSIGDELLKHHIAIRVCESFKGLDKTYARIAVRNDEDNRLLAYHLDKILNNRPARAKRKKAVAALMFQGTSSNAGKSVLTAAMCRVMVQDGIRVAPFKAQNISLNSYVTDDGGEMGRAQALQAQACRIIPDTRMNPILLKPDSKTGSQIIVNGKPIGSMPVSQYVKCKSSAFDIVKQNYDSLASQFDAIVLEGAGSPAEVNLKNHDIVNMRMASYAESPVVLVGDIDRGGVFASFVGTMETFESWEHDLVAGFIVNRFRGDVSQLNSAFDYIKRHTGKPVLGVLPYIVNLGLPEEDSVAFKCGDSLLQNRDEQREVIIGIIDLPHISNFTDFDPLRQEPDVALRIIRDYHQLNKLDAVIIPGSKNVSADMAFLRDSQIAGGLIELAGCSTAADIVGICGGFQMLGNVIADPHGVETSEGECKGLGLLDICTILGPDKILQRTEAIHAISGHVVKGYEIHHGRTTMKAGEVLFTSKKNDPVGIGNSDHRIWGTYLHGVFDCDKFRRWFVDRLRSKKGLLPLGKVVSCYDIEPALDRLADIFREAIDVKNLYRLMGL